MSKAKRG